LLGSADTWVGDGTPDAGDGGIPSIVDLAWLQLDFDDLAASVIPVRADDKAFTTAIYTVVNGDDIARNNNIVSRHFDEMK